MEESLKSGFYLVLRSENRIPILQFLCLVCVATKISLGAFIRAWWCVRQCMSVGGWTILLLLLMQVGAASKCIVHTILQHLLLLQVAKSEREKERERERTSWRTVARSLRHHREPDHLVIYHDINLYFTHTHNLGFSYFLHLIRKYRDSQKLLRINPRCQEFVATSSFKRYLQD